MDLIGSIEKLRQKPRRTREKILVASVAGVMLVLIFIWFTALRQTFSAASGKARVSGGRPFEIVGGLLNQGLEALKKGVNF
ncbi:MAG: hypothetical protein HY446_00670 [Candidatus Niyogibacteria bacterium]|nr:hypothetical protein [Candidatus Niyogibacteria bacterium]